MFVRPVSGGSFLEAEGPAFLIGRRIAIGTVGVIPRLGEHDGAETQTEDEANRDAEVACFHKCSGKFKDVEARVCPLDRSCYREFRGGLHDADNVLYQP